MKIYHNPDYFDCYTLLVEGWYNGKSCDAFGFSENALSPQGFNQFIGDVYEGAHLGKEISFEDLPEVIKKAITTRVK